MSEVHPTKSFYLRRIRLQQTSIQPKILHYDPLVKDLRVWIWYVQLTWLSYIIALFRFHIGL